MKRDYYKVAVPGDVYDTVEQLGQLAIDEVRERARLYCMPATWTATLIAGEVGDFEMTFRVKRERN